MDREPVPGSLDGGMAVSRYLGRDEGTSVQGPPNVWDSAVELQVSMH